MQEHKTPEKNYWENRASKKNIFSSLRDKLIQSTFFPLISFVFSTRVSDQKFLKRSLKKSKKVLDIACGIGKKSLANKPYTAGVDITGYPKNLAKNKGYNELCTYDPPHYIFNIKQKVDSIVMTFLNAHISFDAFQTILNNSLQFLEEGGTVILINEYDNNGLSYKALHKNKKRFKEFVNGMEHYFLEYESDFLRKLESHTSLEIKRREPLIAAILPFMHYSAYYLHSSNYKLWKIPALLFDAVFGTINSIHCLLSKSHNKSFVVGYELVVKNASSSSKQQTTE